ncbi:MAG: CCA tRNA nucleotidyltransferase [Pseudomonadota bacterium]
MSPARATPPETALPSLAGAEWLERSSTRAVMAAIAGAGHGVRAVGGAVRNALIGVPVRDVDLATTALPEEVMALAQAAGLKAVATGIEHGTVTIVAHHQPIEVTTLRKDVATDGRRAVVSFTTDWEADAARRDFTLNALYCDGDGTLHDPLGGYRDLAARRVRFIGDPHARIREDYLRILRFFRLFAEYGVGDPDEAGYAASIAERGGLTLLSGERIRVELLRLLAAPRALEAVEAMSAGGILELLVGARPTSRVLSRLIEIERRLAGAPDAVLRLAALAVHEVDDAPRLAERLKLANAEAARLAAAATYDVALLPRTGGPALHAFLYRHGLARFLDAELIDWARSDDPPDSGERLRRIEEARQWPPPALPFRGADVVALGVAKGTEVGRVLDVFEEWWIASDFPRDAELLRRRLAEIARA